jgi:kynurenine formamidase
VDPPAHFHKGLRTVDEIPLNEMVAPLVVINISEKAMKDPDALLSLEDIRAWESMYGKIPEGAFVAARSDWSKRWPDLYLMQNPDEKGVMHYPGWSVNAVKFLIQDRKIAAIGHETTDTDGGLNVSDDRYPAQTYVHGKNHYQIELLTNLDQVPEFGALAVVSFPKPENGSGFPARVFAILP